MERLSRGFGFKGLSMVGGEALGAFQTLGRELTTGAWEFGGSTRVMPPAMTGAREGFGRAGKGFMNWALAKEFSGPRRLGAIGMRGALMYGAYGAATGTMFGGSNRGMAAGAAVGGGAGYLMGGPVGAIRGAGYGAVAGKLLSGGLGPAAYGAAAPIRTTTDLFTSAVGSVTSMGSTLYGLSSNMAINPLGGY